MASGTDRARLDPALRRTRDLAERFAAAGHRVYLVGGVVRDALLGDDAHDDLDLTTDAVPAEIRSVIDGWADDVWLQGERFGTIGCRHDGDTFEITTHRAEVYDPASRKPEVAFGDDIATDLSRRDFTVNAMAVDVLDHAWHDPFGGEADLGRGVLRTPLAPEVSFGDDPLRMLRAARFIARFGLEPAPELEAAAAAMVDRLSIVSAERIRDELMKLLALDRPATGLSFLDRTGTAAQVVPELDLRAGVDELPPEPHRRLALLLLGAGPEVAAEVVRRLRGSSDEVRTVERVVAAVDGVLAAAGGDGAARRWAAAAGSDRQAALEVARVVGRAGVEELVERVTTLSAREDLDDLEPPLDGDEVMALLGIEPGPQVGEALRLLREARLDDGPLTRSEAEELLRRSFRP